MTKLRKILILDDDIRYSGLLALKLRMHFPEILITTRETPTLPAGYDVYILDNDFGGSKMGAGLAEDVRRIAPKSLVVVLSGTLEFDLLKRLVNCHAAGVFDKSKDGDTARLIQLIDHFVQSVPSADTSPAPDRSLGTALASIRGVLDAWNQRLVAEEDRLGR